MDQNNQFDWSRRLLLPAVVTMLIAKLWLSFTRYLNQDEFETLHQGWLIFSGAVQFRDFNSNHPPVAFSIAAALNYLTSDPIVLIYLGRTVTLLSALASLFLIHQISKSVFEERAARWSTIAYCLNATFWEWSIEIRSDFASVPLWLFGVYLFVLQAKCVSYRRALTIGLVLGLAFWANQKVVFLVVPLGLFMLLGGVHKTWRIQHTAVALLGSILCSLGFLAHASYIGSLSHMFQHNFEGAWALVLSGDYAAWRNWTILQACRSDLLFVVFGLIASVWSISQSGTRLGRFAGASAVWMAGTLFLTPGPFPYFLTSVFPFFAVSIGGWLSQLEITSNNRQLIPRERQLIMLVAVLYVAFPLTRFAGKFIQPTISRQIQVVRLVNAITDSDSTVFDGAGVQLNRPDAYPFHWVLWKGELQRYAAISPAEDKQIDSDSSHKPMPKIFPLLMENKCEVVIENYRLAKLPAEDRRQIERRFVPWWGPIRVPGFDSIVPVGTDPVSFDLSFEGDYVSNLEHLLIDGKPWASGESLQEGLHTIALSNGQPARVTLQRMTKADQLRPATDHIDPKRFLQYYGYGY